MEAYNRKIKYKNKKFLLEYLKNKYNEAIAINKDENSNSKQNSGRNTSAESINTIFLLFEKSRKMKRKKPRVSIIPMIFQTHQKNIKLELRKIGNFKINLPQPFNGTSSPFLFAGNSKKEKILSCN